MHEMDKTPKIITIIGLVFEGIGFIGTLIGYYVLANFEDFPGVSLAASDMEPAEWDEFLELMSFFADIMVVLALIMGVFFLINVLLFTKMIRGNMSEESAHKTYLYQAIWGGVNLLFNQITGILYLISGVNGFNGNREERNIRDGI